MTPKPKKAAAREGEIDPDLFNLLQEIVQCICYQPDFPYNHKCDMAHALHRLTPRQKRRKK